MIAHAGSPCTFWAEAISTAAYVRYRLPTSVIQENKSPYEIWYGRKLNTRHLGVFGFMVYAHAPDNKRRTLNQKAEGYDAFLVKLVSLTSMTLVTRMRR